MEKLANNFLGAVAFSGVMLVTLPLFLGHRMMEGLKGKSVDRQER